MERIPLEIPKSKRDLYKFNKTVGSGAFGLVWDATEIATDKRVAIKELKNFTEAQMKSALQEIEILQDLSKDGCLPSIVCYYTHFVENRKLYIVMEFIDGMTLQQFANQYKDNPNFIKYLIAIIADLTKGLQHIHRLKIIHRDIKPDNIMITKDTYQPKLIDFGLSCLSNKYDDEDFCIGSHGTPLYQSPETLLNNISYYESDIWSLGASIYKVYTGNHLFKLEKMNMTHLKTAMLTQNIIPVKTENVYFNTLVNSMLVKPHHSRLSETEIFKIVDDYNQYLETMKNVKVERII